MHRRVPTREGYRFLEASSMLRLGEDGIENNVRATL